MVVHGDDQVTFVAGEVWHSDVSCDVEPPMGSILRIEQVPTSGGDTLFASMYAAYEALSDRLQRWLGELTAIHEGRQYYVGRYGEGHLRDATYPAAEHPAVRTHPVTRRQALYVNEGFTTGFKELKKTESDALLALLLRHCAAPEFQCRFRWHPNSVAFWDNRCTQHRAIWDYYPQTRHGYRVSIRGDRPYYDPHRGDGVRSDDRPAALKALPPFWVLRASSLHYSFSAPSSLLKARSKVPSGRCPALRAISSRRQSEKPSRGRVRNAASARATTSESCNVSSL